MPRKLTIPLHTALTKSNIGTKDYGLLLSVILLTFLVFYPTLSSDFVNWDDDVNLLNNPQLLDFNWSSVKNIFSSTILGNYNPLPILSFALESHFFGQNPFVFHLNNLLLHLGSVVLVFLIAHRVGCTGFGAAIATAIFAIHPMHVESVAWVSQRKDVLFGLFFLAACFSYLLYIAKDRKGYQIHWVYIFFILSCLSKIQAVALPLMLLGFDYLLEKKMNWNLLKEKIGFFGISLLFGLGGIYALNNFGSIDATKFSLLERMGIGAFSFCVYIYKFFLPTKLSAVYAYPQKIPLMYYGCLLPFAVFLLMLYQAFKQKRKKTFLAGWIFLVNIIFVLQFLGAGQAFQADRFSYLPYLGLAIGVGYILNTGIEKYPNWKLSLQVLPIFLLLFFAIQSFHQTQVWNNSESLWSNAIRLYPNLHIAYHNRGLFYLDQNKPNQALSDLNQAIALNSEVSNYYNSRGKTFIALKKIPQALGDYTKAIQLDPDQAKYYNHRSVAFAIQGNYQTGLDDLNQAIQIDPSLVDAYLNRALIYGHTKQFEAALQDNLAYLAYVPKAVEIWVEAGMNARMLGKSADAARFLNQALRLDPSDSSAREELALLK